MSVTIVIVVITLFLLYWRNRYSQRFLDLASKIPGPPGLPLIGNALAVSRHPKGMFNYFVTTIPLYGTVARFWIGSSLFVYLTDPKDVEIILRDTQNIKKSIVYDYVKPWLGSGLVTSTGEHWHTHRKIITPAFHFNILEKFVDIFNGQGKTLIKILKEKHCDGKPFDILHYITLYTLDAIMETSMGKTINAQMEKEIGYVTSLDTVQKNSMLRVFNPLIRPKCIFDLTKLGRDHNKHLKIVHGFCNDVIQEKKEELKDIDFKTTQEVDEIGKKKRMAFLDLLIIGQKMGSGFTDKDILEEVNTFLFAGHDTTSLAITFALYLLAENPDIQQKAYEEIIELFGEVEEVSMQDLQKTKYLDMVVKEALRIFPPVPSFSRLLETELKLSNYTIPVGTSVACLTYLIHRNPEIYPEPEVFDPERFSPENTKSRHPYAFIPFSAGPRNCIGQRYAMLEIKSTVIEIVRNFELSHGEKVGILESFVVLHPKDGIKICLKSRI